MRAAATKATTAEKTRPSGIAAFNRFVSGMRGTWSVPMKPAERWEKAGRLLAVLLADDALAAHARNWPPSEEGGGRYSNHLFYEDPDYNFVINGLVKAAGSATPVHDHGDSWTIYGVLSGIERIVHYEPLEGAPAPDRMKLVGEFKAGRGFVDVVPPGRLHAEIAGRKPTIAVIVRSRRVGKFLQNMYDPATGAIERRPGPMQRPFRLA